MKQRSPPSADQSQSSIPRAVFAKSGTSKLARAKVLIVDDDELVVDTHRRVVAHSGFDATAATTAAAALELLKAGEAFDVIVTDIIMPGMDGVALLREVRKYNLDVPVVLMTGNPSIETAVATVQHGGFRYMMKPVTAEALIQVVGEAIALHHLALLKREAMTLLASQQKQLGVLASLEVHFEQALEQLWIAYQPIVDWNERTVFGYEALVRSAAPELGNPALLFDAAERLGRVRELGRTIRRLVAKQMTALPQGVLMFVNLHALDLEDPDLENPRADLSGHACRTILEVTERNALDDISDISDRIGRLRLLGYRIAVDDLGAGYAGLSCFSHLEPDVVKLDMSLIRGIDAAPRMQSLVHSMISVCNRELGIRVVSEGVETTAERETLVSLGADLLQGYGLARPGLAFPEVKWS